MPVPSVLGVTVALLNLASMAHSMFFPDALQPHSPKVCTSDDLTLKCTYTGPLADLTLVSREDPARERANWTQMGREATYILSNISTEDNNLNIYCCQGNCEEGTILGVVLLHVYNNILSGALEPTNGHACIGENLTLTCRLNDSQKPCLVYLHVYPSEKIITQYELVDKYSYKFTFVNVSKQTLEVICMCDSWRVTRDSDEWTIIKVLYTQPIPLQDFHCEVYNYQDNMTCTWNLGQKYEPNPPDIECNFRLPELSGSWTPCLANKVPDNLVTVVFNSTRAGDFSLKPVEFNMTVASKCGKNVSGLYSVITKDTVRPAPAKDLASAVINSTCIEWSYRQDANYHRQKKYNLTVSSRWNDEKVFTGLTKEENNSLVVCDLHPFTEYTMTVQLHPENKGYWSRPMSISNTTLQSVPSSGPEVIPGSCYWNPQDCIRGNHRDLTVYWQDIPENHKNGEITFFTVSLTPLGGGDVIVESDIAYRVRQKSFLGQRVRCDSDYAVSVIAYTIIGPSPMNSYPIQIAKYGTDLPQPEFWAEIVNQTNVVNGTQTVAIHLPQVSTGVKEKLKVQSFTVCYCRTSMGNCQSNVPVTCLYADGSEDTVNVTVTFPEDYLYGVSMTTPLGNSGLMWQSCVYLQNAVPTKAPLDVMARTGADDNTIMVLWSRLPCESGQPYIDSYTIQYCPVEKSDMPCSGSCKQLSVSGTDSSHTIEELIKDQTYCFTVMGVTSERIQGPASKPAFAVAKNKNLKTGEIAGIVVGVLFVLVMFGGVIFFVSSCKKRMKAWKLKKMEVKMPDIPAFKEEFNTEYDDLGDQSEENVEYENEPSTPYVVLEDLDNGKKPGLQRQVSKDSGVEDPESPKPLPEGYCRVASPGLPPVPEHRETEPMAEKLTVGHLEMGHRASRNQAVTVGRVEMGSGIGFAKEVKGHVGIGQAEGVKTEDETQRKEISMHPEHSDSGIDTSKSNASNCRQLDSSGETDLKQLAGHFVSSQLAPFISNIPVPAAEADYAFDSGGQNQKRNIHNLKLNLDGSSGFNQASNPCMPNTDYVFAINGEMTPITSESPHVAPLRIVPMPNEFKATTDQQPDSIIQDNDSFSLEIDSSSSAPHWSQSQSNKGESDYMKVVTDGYVTNGIDLKNGDNVTSSKSNPINNKVGLTDYVSTTDGLISSNQNEATRQRQSSGCSGGSDSTDSGVNSDRANQGSQRSSLSDSGEESNFNPFTEFQPDKNGYVFAVPPTVGIN
ncbi:uncharacterized protein LOC127849355 isoform X3 [Dreissena polymorpha]|uniref:uncharacterized protein LOC127849355 isoform X3 n=1 Tax=Dreissena polymorpha TaxID=45954 RepID=UPI00226507C4|nr:uncharacterized protein LOC127849355 isoform X3 [Dreissena polymorpha]